MPNIKCLDEVLQKMKVPYEETVYQKGYRYGEGTALRLVRPKNTEQLSEILQCCNSEGIGVVPQGGNSGLVGSSTADNSGKQVVIGTDLLNKDIFQLEGNSLKVGAGFILDTVNQRLENEGMFLPIDIGASGSANIGGLISTNAAGSRAARYGNTKARTSEITVVTANGEVKQIKTDMRAVDPELPQDNSKIDPNNPFIGSQGYLGVIADAVMIVEQKPIRYETVVLVPKNIEAISNIRQELQNDFSDGLIAFEGMSGEALRLVGKNIQNTGYLFADEPQKVDYALLAEVATKDENEDLDAMLYATLERLTDSKDVTTGLMGNSHLYWHHRHHISEAIKLEGQVIATDIAVRGADNLSAFRLEASEKLKNDFPDLMIVPFGHEALGAMHFNMVCPKEKELSPALKKEIQTAVYELAVGKYKGTFSAEHGVGPHNAWAYDRFTADSVKSQAEKLKRQYDPKDIMNPNLNYGFSKLKGLNVT
ncbi:MAG: FAD-binding oxidoreductase [Rickettsiales bacterium]|nr:FAD-binding oxidoreductase [Rickettsiales bacterium]